MPGIVFDYKGFDYKGLIIIVFIIIVFDYKGSKVRFSEDTDIT